MRAIFSFRTFWYFLYALALTGTLLYLRFPTEKFIQYCEKRIESYTSASKCNIGRIVYKFPLALIANDVELIKTIEDKRSTLHLDRLVVSFDKREFPNAIALSGEIYQGTFTSKLKVNVSDKSFQLNDFDLQGFDLKAWASDFNMLERKISGVAEFKGSYQASFAHPLKGTGKGDIIANAGMIEMLQPVLSLADFEFEKIFVTVNFESGMLKLIGGEVEAKEFSSDFTGEMEVLLPLMESGISLTGNLAMKEDFFASHPNERKIVEQLLRRYKMAGLPFKVGGTVQTPTFRFSK